MQEEKTSFIQYLDIHQRTKYFVWVLFVLSLASIMLFVSLLKMSSQEKEEAQVVIRPNAFDSIALEGRGVVVWDVLNQREIFAKNPDLALPLASLTKVMTVLTASEILPKAEQVKIIEEYLIPEGDSRLVVGDTWDTKDLIDFTLLTSSNDGAYALASVAEAFNIKNSLNSHAMFIKKMNDTALNIGLTNSHFFNEHGLDREVDRGGSATRAGGYGSAKDMATLFEYTLTKFPHLLEATRYKSLALHSNENLYDATNTNIFVDEIPGLLASKTGYTELAGGNLVVAFDAGLNRPIVISVLGSSQEGRFTDTMQLINATLKYIHDN